MQRLKFSEIFSRRRKQLGLTQGDIAAYVGVSNAAVSKWEQGISYPELTLLPRLATLMDMSIDALLGYDPQLTQSRINELYTEFAERFGREKFEQVQQDIEKVIHEYYSCYPFLISMAQLYMNYYVVADQPHDVLQRVIKLCERVMGQNEDFRLAHEARILHGTILLLSNKPDELLTYLGEEIPIQYGEEQLIAKAHVMLGNLDQAKLMLQTSEYQHLFATISSATEGLLLEVNQPEHFDRIVDRVGQLLTLFNIKDMNFNISLVFYYQAALGYMLQLRSEQALEMLKLYYKACGHIKFPIQLRGDDYFYLIDQWLSKDVHFRTQAPRDEQSIKRDMINILQQQPAFAPLHEHPDFKVIITNLKHQLQI